MQRFTFDGSPNTTNTSSFVMIRTENCFSSF